MLCENCNKQIYDVPYMESDTSEYYGSKLTTFNYYLKCEHCGSVHALAADQYYGCEYDDRDTNI